MEELQIPYEVVRYERDKVTRSAPPALLAVHPLGKAPVITDGDVTIAESGFIIEYLLEKYAQGCFIPKDDALRQRMRYFIHYAEGSLGVALMDQEFQHSKAKSGPPQKIKGTTGVGGIVRRLTVPLASRRASWKPGTHDLTLPDPQLLPHLEYLESELRKYKWFAGPEISGADFQMSFPLEVIAHKVGITADNYPKVHSYINAIQARPGYKSAVKKGGPHEYILPLQKPLKL